MFSGNFTREPAEYRSLWIGDVDVSMTEDRIKNFFPPELQVLRVKLIRDRATNIPVGYGFIEFPSRAAASRALLQFNGRPIPGTNRAFRLNFASKTYNGGGQDNSVFVSGLVPEITDIMLHDFFASRYRSVTGARVVTDLATGISRGYGFVRFADEAERNRAIHEMNGAILTGKPIKTSTAQAKKTSSAGHDTPFSRNHTSHYQSNKQIAQAQLQRSFYYEAEGDNSVSTICVDNIDPQLTEAQIRNVFSNYGPIIGFTYQPSRNKAFIQYSNAFAARNAQNLNGCCIGRQHVRVTPSHAQTISSPTELSTPISTPGMHPDVNSSPLTGMFSSPRMIPAATLSQEVSSSASPDSVFPHSPGFPIGPPIPIMEAFYISDQMFTGLTQ